MRKKFIILLSLVTLKLAAASADLCHIQLVVPNAANSSKHVLLSSAFAQAALQVSGQTSVAQAPELNKPAENELLKLVKSYSYKFQDEQQIFDVTFDYAAVRKKLVSHGFAVLPDNRPYTIMWLALLDADNQPMILSSDSTAPLKAVLESKSAAFGLPIILPLLDFADTTAIEVQDVIEVNHGILSTVSKKYSAQNIVAGKISFEDEMWHARFTMLNYPDATWTITSDSVEKIADLLFNNIAVALIHGLEPSKTPALPDKAKETKFPKAIQANAPATVEQVLQDKPTQAFNVHNDLEIDSEDSIALPAAPTKPLANQQEKVFVESAPVKQEAKKMHQLSLHVAGINDLDKYATIISYLRRIDGVREVEVAELGEDSALFSIESAIPLRDLNGIISKDNFLRASSSSAAADKDNEMRFILSS